MNTKNFEQLISLLKEYKTLTEFNQEIFLNDHIKKDFFQINATLTDVKTDGTIQCKIVLRADRLQVQEMCISAMPEDLEKKKLTSLCRGDFIVPAR